MLPGAPPLGFSENELAAMPEKSGVGSIETFATEREDAAPDFQTLLGTGVRPA